MKFTIELKTTPSELKQFTEMVLSKILEINEAVLTEVGLEFVRNARTNAPYEDHTGNLRSSKYLILVHDGQVIQENFEESAKGTDRITGIETAREIANSISSEYPKGWVLIVGAAMEYASFVEAKGFDVISGSTLGAEKRLSSAFQTVLNQIIS
ncbi:hypothetical protein [Mucilaginibacter paludis]|nr:hypothetical protein [Mucilaginibacter paludis]